MKQKKRKYISVYFDDTPLDERKKRDVTLAFSPSDVLYKKCKNFGSSEVKETIAIYSYKDLVKKAKSEDRTINNYIKYKLKEKLR
jgi:hypothetical protein